MYPDMIQQSCISLEEHFANEEEELWCSCVTEHEAYIYTETAQVHPMENIINTTCLHKINFNPLKTEFLPNNIYKFSSYLAGNTLRLYYKAQPVNAVWGNNRCLL
jgi:hypothetical protein